MIVLAGKGHETYQIIGTEKTHLDEREEVASAL
jgi:UDP-N-acetylmuramoyl-L-alanyl-D-glutamate--2,6-diaminopimelate ligase